ncbi:MAG: molybdopterin molybdotransferase MoeA [Rhodobacteraceae bacterium]|nr:molybdopterin molybdotransferase MoeA [Paracoccaceae bacterium]
MNLMPFAEARERTLARVSPLAETEILPVVSALGRVLAEPVVAPFDVPNHDNTSMDGYAVRFNDLAPSGDTTLTVVADLPAGDRLAQTIGAGEAVRIMTGAPIPDGCDCIVIQEVVARDGNQLTVPQGQKQAQNIRRAGQDIAAGSEVFSKGRRLSPPDIGMLTSLGLSEAKVHRRLKVAVVSTGNEVIAPGTPLEPGQVYDSNRSSMKAVLQALGVDILDLGIIRDEKEAIAAALRKGAAEADVVLTSGGVSVGDFDLVTDVISELGSIDFWKVRMKPGKPQAHGRIGNAIFFGLPGNPVSVLATFLLLVRPAMLVMMGCPPERQKQLSVKFRGTPINKTGDRMEFARGILHYEGADAWIESTGSQNSGILTSMSKANALIVLPDDPIVVNEGDTVTVIPIEY